VLGAIRGKTLTVCNIGDSRVILGRADPRTGKLKAVPVTDDHKPEREDEKKRILARGGRVFAVEYDDGIDGPPRVWLGHMDIPGLAMSRSLGDTVAHTAGVISTPETHTVELTPEDKVMVWASDGLWEFNKNEEVVAMAGGNGDPRKAVDALVADANARWMKEEQVIDDTTVIVAYLDIKK
jgi:serine/threonine protein phosphatase PrpC